MNYHVIYSFVQSVVIQNAQMETFVIEKMNKHVVCLLKIKKAEYCVYYNINEAYEILSRVVSLRRSKSSFRSIESIFRKSNSLFRGFESSIRKSNSPFRIFEASLRGSNSPFRSFESSLRESNLPFSGLGHIH